MMQPARVGPSRQPGGRASRRAFLVLAALLFAVSAAATTVWCTAMPAMGGLPMPGGWVLSVALAPSPGQAWPVAVAAFLGMWVVMTLAMMLPSLVPTLWRYREALSGAGGQRPGRFAVLVGLGYFCVWTAFGAAAVPLGTVLAVMEMQAPPGVVGLAVGLVVLLAGCFQFTAAKARHLACCREAPGRDGRLPGGAGVAWRQGLRRGLHCLGCCAGLMVVLVVIGFTDLRAMAAVAAAITAERLLPAGEHVARAIGVVVVGAGLLLIGLAAGLG